MVEPGQGPGREEPGQSSGSGQDPGRAATGRAYLAGLVLDRRRVVVVGGGEVAQRRLPSLLAAGADPHVRDTTFDSDAWGWCHALGNDAALEVLNARATPR